MSRTASLVLAALLALELPSAATAAESAASRVLGFFTWRPRIPSELRRAIAAYGEGRLLAATAAADRALADADERFRDDCLLVRGLALAELGWTEEAEASLRGVLDARTPSAYYPLALLALVEQIHGGGRLDAATEAHRRYLEGPWRGDDRRSRRIQTLLEAYGELRREPWKSSREEIELAHDKAELAERYAARRERPSERLLYLLGLDLFRAGRCEEALATLGLIGLVSFYQPYALYTASQCHYALGHVDDARARVNQLLGLPPLTREEKALAERAGLLLAQLLFETGQVDQSLAQVGRVGDDGAHALEAQLFRAELLLARGESSLALAFFRDLAARPLEPELEAERALGAARAYAALGDLGSAAESVSVAAAVIGKVRAAVEADAGRAEAERLEQSLLERAAAARRWDEMRRERIADGLERNERFKGPLNLGKIVRVLSVSHRHTVVGEPVVDVARLAAIERPPGVEEVAPSSAASLGLLGLDYLRSPARHEIDSLVSLHLELEREEAEDASRAGAALLVWLGAKNGGVSSAEERLEALRAFSDLVGEDVVGAAPTPSPRELRRLLLQSVTRGEPPRDAAVARARTLAERLIREATARALRSVALARASELRRIDFDLQSELSRLMAARSGVAQAPAPARASNQSP